MSSGQPAVPTWLGHLAFGWFFTAEGENDKIARQVRTSAGIAVFIGDAVDKAHWVEVGRAYERFALQATALGIRNAFLNQPVEVAAVRSPFAAALGFAGRRPRPRGALRARTGAATLVAPPGRLGDGLKAAARSRGSRMTWLLGLGSCLVVLVFAAAGVTALGARRWSGEVAALQASLEASRVDGQTDAGPRPTRYDARELEGLPAPVQRYFRAVLKDGQPIISAVTIDMSGTFNMSPTDDQWKPFASRQRVVTRRPGFLWDARIAMFPGVKVSVVDSYIAGIGMLRATVQGLFSVAQQQGGGEIARGEFMRWFAEAPWYPTALLPSQGVRWAAIDDHAANATMTEGPLRLTLLFRFDDAGLITSFRAEARGSKVGDRMVMAPWEGVWSNYRVHDGVQVPFTGEVAWIRPEGRKPYFIGTLTKLTFEFVP